MLTFLKLQSFDSKSIFVQHDGVELQDYTSTPSSTNLQNYTSTPSSASLQNYTSIHSSANLLAAAEDYIEPEQENLLVEEEKKKVRIISYNFYMEGGKNITHLRCVADPVYFLPKTDPTKKRCINFLKNYSILSPELGSQ